MKRSCTGKLWPLFQFLVAFNPAANEHELINHTSALASRFFQTGWVEVVNSQVN